MILKIVILFGIMSNKEEGVLMSKKDTKYVDVHSMLKAAGKTMFIKFYNDLKDFSLSDKYLCEKVYKESPTAKSPNQRYKVPRAREVFRTNQQIEALELIIRSEKLPADIIAEAKRLLEVELCLVESNEDSSFVNEFNNEFDSKNSDEPFEYNNTPEKPREKSKNSSYVYPRSKKVAFNALKKANFLCEMDSSHDVFMRKNADITYTEPHHLVPLSAQDKFPDVNLDREQNIVSLCSACHNQLHYGKDFENILKPLYKDRKELLKLIGINISYEQLRTYYI